MKIKTSELKKIISKVISESYNRTVDDYGLNELATIIETTFKDAVYELFLESGDTQGDPSMIGNFGAHAEEEWAVQCQSAATTFAEKLTATVVELVESTLETLHDGEHYNEKSWSE